NVEVAAVDARDELRGQTLDSVSSGLIHRLARRRVGVDFGLGERRKPDPSGSGVDNFSIGAAEADPRDHLVHTSGEQTDHACGVGQVDGFAQDFTIAYYSSIRSQHYTTGCRLNRPRLFKR